MINRIKSLKNIACICIVLFVFMLIFGNSVNAEVLNNDKDIEAQSVVKVASNSVSTIVENSLKSLEIEGYQFYPEFNKYNTTYYAVIPTDVTELLVNAEAEAEGAKVAISGTTIKKSEGTIKIVVTPTKGSKKTYTINVTKQDENSLKLASLEIENVNSISPEFSESQYYYDVEVAQLEIKPLVINATANDENASIEIVGNDSSLVEGNNLIAIILTNGDETTTYELNVNITKQFTISQITYENNSKLNEIKENVMNFFSDEKNVLSCLIGVSIVLVILIIIVIVKIRKKKSKKF